MPPPASPGFAEACDSVNRLYPVRDREFAIVGCMMHGREQTEDVLRATAATDFTQNSARLVFDACKAIHATGRDPSMAGVHQYLADLGRLADLGADPAVFLYELYSERAPTDMDLPFHLENIRRDAKLRQLQCIGTQIQSAAIEPFDSVDEMANAFAGQLTAIASERTTDDPVPVAELHEQSVKRWDDLATGKRPRTFATGIESLDHLLGGFSPGTLSILAARPSVGKSALALCFAANVSRYGAPVLFFSLEMTCDEVYDRLAAMTAEVPLNTLRTGRSIDAETATKIVRLGTPGNLATYPIYFDDRAGLTTSQLNLAAKRHARRKGTKLVIVDYLQLLRPENPKEPRYLQIGAAMKILKELAKTAGVAVLCLAQLNREVESGGADGEPQLSHLRDSGEIEQDADVVMFLRRLQNDPALPTHDVDLKVAKQRNGPTGVVNLIYQRPFTRFVPRVSY